MHKLFIYDIASNEMYQTNEEHIYLLKLEETKEEVENTLNNLYEKTGLHCKLLEDVDGEIIKSIKSNLIRDREELWIQ